MSNYVPRPQSIQCRAKGAAHLKPKLEARGLLTSQTIEDHIRDLAGARLIFYTNTDVDRFLQSRLIPENFEVHWEATRVHHPTEENARQRYQAIHYTVSLNAQRAALPEYAMFKGMRCEIQIQTILSHAWAETAHDILYKPPAIAGFGGKAMQAIDRRLTRIMDEYLVPAGYEFQKVQHDFERLMQGKALFDRDALDTLASSTNNNDRHETLSSIKEYVLPNYDDIAGIYGDLQRALVKAFADSRSTPTQDIETPFGNLPGKTPQDITAIIVDILSNVRYVDVAGTFNALLAIYRGEQDRDQREHVLRAVKHLSEYNLHVWRQAGPAVQMALCDAIDQLGRDERSASRDALLTIWHELVSSELSGTSFSANAFMMSSGAIPASADIGRIRGKAIDGLFEALDRAESEADKTAVTKSLWEATRLPSQATFSNELCALVLSDTRRITEFLTQRVSQLPYQLLGHIENQILWLYRRWREVAEAEQDRFNCRDLAASVTHTLLAFRDAANCDRQFVRYKTLVGYESVFEPDWENDGTDFQQTEQHRNERIDQFIDEITDETKAEWLSFIELCASTKSEDMATFPIFGEFIQRLSRSKPVIAAVFLERGSEDLLNFLPAFLNGLFESGARDIYDASVERYLASGSHLAAIARHWHTVRPDTPTVITRLLDKAIAGADDIAVIECAVATVVTQGSTNQPSLETLFVPAMQYLTAKGNPRWVRGVWFRPEARPFFSGLAHEHAQLVLRNLLAAPKVNHDVEKILCYLAENHPADIWRFFDDRLSLEQNQQVSYEPVPHQFHGLEKKLSLDPKLGIDIVRSWYRPDDQLFEFRGARLLSAVFPSCPPAFADGLCQRVEEGMDDDIAFVTAILGRYRGETATHVVLKALIRRLSENDHRLTQVEFCLENTGVVAGPFGFVEAFRAKKAEIAGWLGDEDAKVKAFAAQFMARMDQRIASEQRSAEERTELRKRDYDTDDNEA